MCMYWVVRWAERWAEGWVLIVALSRGGRGHLVRMQKVGGLRWLRGGS